MRGVFIIEDDDFPYHYDEEVVLTLSDHYHKYSGDIMPAFLTRFNPTGAEPIPQNFCSMKQEMPLGRSNLENLLC